MTKFKTNDIVGFIDPKFPTIGSARVVKVDGDTVTIYSADHYLSEDFKKGCLAVPQDELLEYDYEIDHEVVCKFNALAQAHLAAGEIEGARQALRDFLASWFHDKRKPVVKEKQERRSRELKTHTQRVARVKEVNEAPDLLATHLKNAKESLKAAKEELRAGKEEDALSRKVKKSEPEGVVELRRRKDEAVANEDFELAAQLAKQLKDIAPEQPGQIDLLKLNRAVTEKRTKVGELELKLHKSKADKKRLGEIQQRHPTWTLDRVFEQFDVPEVSSEQQREFDAGGQLGTGESSSGTEKSPADASGYGDSGD